mgnify:CR=1 FL=1
MHRLVDRVDLRERREAELGPHDHRLAVGPDRRRRAELAVPGLAPATGRRRSTVSRSLVRACGVGGRAAAYTEAMMQARCTTDLMPISSRPCADDDDDDWLSKLGTCVVTLKDGDSFGELALMGNGIRSASVVTAMDTHFVAKRAQHREAHAVLVHHLVERGERLLCERRHDGCEVVHGHDRVRRARIDALVGLLAGGYAAVDALAGWWFVHGANENAGLRGCDACEISATANVAQSMRCGQCFLCSHLMGMG